MERVNSFPERSGIARKGLTLSVLSRDHEVLALRMLNVFNYKSKRILMFLYFHGNSCFLFFKRHKYSVRNYTTIDILNSR
jgi:hypothetical protein